MNMNINSILRLSKYQAAVSKYKTLGLQRVFSNSLADAIGASPVQVRKDFSIFGIHGNKKGGYLVADIFTRLNAILRKTEVRKIIIVGAGNIGTALMNFKGFELNGIHIAACFDIDPETFSPTAAIPVLPLDDFRPFVRAHGIKAAVLCVPEYAAQHVADIMTASGIKGILNFAPIKLRVPKDCHVSDISLVHEIDRLFYLIHARNGGKERR